MSKRGEKLKLTFIAHYLIFVYAILSTEKTKNE